MGFSATIRKIRKIRCRISLDSFFLPTRRLTLEIRRQYRRKPARCQRTTVSGVPTRRACFQAEQNWHASAQKSLCKLLISCPARISANYNGFHGGFAGPV